MLRLGGEFAALGDSLVWGLQQVLAEVVNVEWLSLEHTV